MFARLADQNDKSQFSALAASNPLLKRVADKVETELRGIRAQGQNIEREKLADYLIGKEIREKGVAALKSQKVDGQRRIQQQRVRPEGGRSDQNASRDDRQRAQRMARLENVTF
jgi:hypothetical protein